MRKQCRIYSVAEIFKMAKEENFTTEFLWYLSHIDEKKREYIFSFIETPGYKEEIHRAIDKNLHLEENIIKDESEKKELLDKNKKKELYISFTNILQVYSRYKEEIELQQIIFEPYSKFIFKDRVDVEEIHIWECKKNQCPVCNSELKHVQVVINYGQGRRYGLGTKCCEKCKRICMDPSDIHDYVGVFEEKKGIKYYIH